MTPLLALAALVLALPWLLGEYFTALLVLMGIYVIATSGLTILMGFAGQVSLAQAAFYGIGAYTSMLLTMRAGVPVVLAILLAPLAAGAIAHGVGRLSLRLRGHYLALATLAFGIIAFIVFLEAEALTGGPSGVTGIPRPTLGPWTLSRDVHYAYGVWALALTVLWGARRLVGSGYGRLLRALASSEPAAEAMGVDIQRLKLQVFVLSAALGGIAGALYAHWITVISPTAFGFDVSVELLVMAVVGGLGSVWGPVLGVATVTLGIEALRHGMPSLRPGASAEYEVLAFGLLIVVVMVFLPDGLAGVAGRVRQRRA
jgi:branched-chain amino acid transport system permease protein